MPETDLEKLKKTFDEIGVFYTFEEDGEDVYLYTCSEEDALYFKETGCRQPELFDNDYFQFTNGKLGGYT